MKLLERARGIRKSPKNIEFETEEVKEYDIDLKNEESVEENIGWDELVQPKHIEAPKALAQKASSRILEIGNIEYKSRIDARIDRRIVGALVHGANGHIDRNMLNQYDVEIDSETYEYALYGLATGRYGRKQKREILDSIPGPLQNMNNSANVVNSLNPEEKRLLGKFSLAGSDSWESIHAGDLRMFIEMYPTPMDFQARSDAFLDSIKGENNKAKFESMLKTFKNKVYGDKQKYWERLIALNAESDKYVDRKENERSSEWEPGSVGVRQTSRKQAKNGLVNFETIERNLWADDSCEDKFYADGRNQFYVLCDGAGGEVDGREAAEITTNYMMEYRNVSSADELLEAVKAVDVEVCKDTRGITTIVAAKLVNKADGVQLNYVSVGDSRIYIVGKNGETRQITKDQSENGNQLTNWIGNKGPNTAELVSEWKAGSVSLKPGDRVVMCSDGITGDFEPDLRSEKEIGNIVRGSHGAQDAANNLVAAASKKDDRTAIVITPDFDRG